jgi:hypothetical protein
LGGKNLGEERKWLKHLTNAGFEFFFFFFSFFFKKEKKIEGSRGVVPRQ